MLPVLDADFLDEFLQQGFAGVIGTGLERIADPLLELGEVRGGGRGDLVVVEVGLESGAAGSEVGEPAGVGLDALPAGSFGEGSGLERGEVPVDCCFGFGGVGVDRGELFGDLVPASVGGVVGGGARVGDEVGVGVGGGDAVEDGAFEVVGGEPVNRPRFSGG